MESNLFIRFSDQSESFVSGCEYGRILSKMESEVSHVDNCGFPIHLCNVEVIKKTCSVYNYIPVFGKKYYSTYIDFFAIKNCSNNN